MKTFKEIRDELSRFFSYVEYSADCWEWVGAKRKGYGVFRLSNPRQSVYAHRYSYEYFKEPLGKLFCCHHCDNPGCINPFHLFAGTTKDNIRDLTEKGLHPESQKTHCKNGHEFNVENTKWQSTASKKFLPYRRCRICIRSVQKRYDERQKHALK